MADDKDAGILGEFEEFLNAKREAEKESNAAADDDVEIWDEKGRGARVKRSVAKPFLQSLGIDVDPPSNDGGDNSGDADKGNSAGKPKGKAPAKQATSSSVARKYFVKK